MAMTFKTFQECRQADGWQPVKVSSSSEANKSYTVLVNPWGADQENLCECQGYIYRGQCRHQQEAADKLCRWREGAPEVQTPSERYSMICPRCSKQTKWQVEVDES